MSAVPAWKRLGLKLKGASSDGSPVSTVPQTTTTSAPLVARPSYRQQQPNSNGGGQYGNDNGTPFKKRNQYPSAYSAPDNKRPRRDDSDFTPSKRVSFSQDTKKAAPKKAKKKKAPKPQTLKQPFDFTPVVEYLRTWHTARDNWKFNKNHQTLLIKHLYESDAIPSSDIDTFYLYISDIKGASRQRLLEQAKEVIKKDMDDGIKNFPDGTKAPEDKQKQYEELLVELLKKKADIKDDAATNGNGKRPFNEVEFVLRTTVDKHVQQRMVKRMRAETIVDALESSDSGESTDMSAAVTKSASSSRVMIPVANGDADAANGSERPKQKTKRRKKLRTAESDSSSSDSDSSDSDSESDSDGPTTGAPGSSNSSSDSDSDEDMQTATGLPGADASSSSSSSSSESGSDSEADGSVAGLANGDDSGSDGDSESSDDEEA